MTKPRCMPSKRLLIASNLVTLALLGALAHHYRVPQKLWRAWGVENRIPLVTPAHELNRNYQASRQLFDTYRKIPKPILLFGDSHIRLASWTELLGRDDTANRGIDGDTLEGIRHRLADEAGTAPAAVVILGGTNDLIRGTKIDEMKQSMTALLDEARRIWPDTPLLVTSVPPVAAWHTDCHRINDQASAFNRWLQSQLAEHSNSRFLDLNATLRDASGHLDPSMTSDGVHFSAKAYNALRHQIEAALP